MNPSRGYYERLGTHLIPEGIDLDVGEFDDDDVVYGFDDVCRLL